MASLQFVIGWYIFLAFFVWAIQRMTRCFTRLNIFTLFSVFLLLRHGITVPFDERVNPERWAIPLSPYTLPRFYLALALMYLMLLVGIYAGRKLFGAAQLSPEKFRTEMRARRLPHGINPPVFIAVVLIAVAVVITHSWGSGISLTDLFSGELSALDYRAARDDFGLATNYTGGPLLRLAAIARFGAFPLLIGTLFFLMDYGWFWRGLFATVLGVGMNTGLLSGQKSPAVYLLLGVAVAFYLRRGRLKLYVTDWRLWALGGFGLLVILPYLYRLQYPQFDYLTAVNATFYRLTSEPDRALQLYFQFYPEIQPFMWGGSSGLLNAVLGRAISPDLAPERFIAVYYLGTRYLNTWNAAFVGTAWADFGYPGVVIESLIVGLLLQGYASWFARAHKTALVMGTQVALIMAAIRLSEVTLTAAFLTYGLLSSFLLYWMLRSYRWNERRLPPVDAVALQTGRKLAD